MFENSEDKVVHAKQVWHGALVAWHDDLQTSITPITTTHERYAAILLRIPNSTQAILVVSLYAPTSGKDDDFLDCLGFLSEFLSLNIPEGGSLIIGADSNCSNKSSIKIEFNKTILILF